jgi:hypothetical protein
VRSAPGVAATFSGLRQDGSHAVLDLGPAAEGSLRLYGSFARQIRFVDLLTDPPQGQALIETLDSIPPLEGGTYDLVFAWDLLDRLRPEDRQPLVRRLAQLTASGARLYVLVDASERAEVSPLRFNILDLGHVSQVVAGPARPAHPQLLPAEVERLLEPFRVVSAFTLRLGLREYVGVRRTVG